MVLSIGQQAPEFELIDNEGNPHKLSDFRGQTIVIYFYPKDDTPGCTKEACSFRDTYADYKQAGVEIIGISPDNEKSHSRFIQNSKYQPELVPDILKAIEEASKRSEGTEIKYVIISHIS